MKKIMKLTSAVVTVAAIILAIVNCVYPTDIAKTLAITFFTTAYHFLIRLLVGYVIQAKYKNKINNKVKWFKELRFERKLYKALKIKRLKVDIPTYDEEAFDYKKNTQHEIVMAMCQAEIVHEIIILVSFIPLLFSLFVGSFWVFFITSVLAAVYETQFVVVQRFNRARLIRLINKKATYK